MATLKIGDHSVTVDDAFLGLPPEQQNAAVEEIAGSLGARPASFADRFAGDGGGERAVLRAGLERQAEGMGSPSRGRSAALGAVQGALANFGDEAASAVNAGIDVLTGQAPDGFGTAYDRRLESARRQVREAEAINPRSFLAGQVGGGLASGVVLPGAGAGIRGSIAGGALYGGAAGAGAGEGVADRAAQAATGAVVGGALGAAVPTVINAVTAAGRGVANAARGVTGQVRGAISPEAEAARRVQSALTRDAELGATQLDDAAVSAAQTRGQPATVMDMGGETTRALARSAANTSPEGRAVLSEAIEPRFEGQNSRVADFVQRLVGNTGDAGAVREALQRQAKAANRPAYARAYGDPAAQAMWDEGFAQILQAPAVQAAVRDATRKGANKAAADGFRPVRNPFVLDEAGGFTLARNPDGSQATPTLQFWDVVKQGLDDQIGAAVRKGEKGDVADLLELKNALVRRLDELVPSYKQARAGAAAFFGADDALTAGQQFLGFKGANHEARRALSRMSEPERKLFAEGFADELMTKVMNVADRRDVLNSIFLNSKAARERIEIALGKDKAREMEAFLRVENVMDQARKAIQGNSTTARQLAEMTLAGGIGGASAWNGDYKTAGAAALVAGLRFGQHKIDARVARKVADMLASSDPAQVRKAAVIIGRSRPMLEAVRSAEDYIVRALGPAANENVAQPLTLTVRPALSGPRPTAASDGEPNQEENRQR